MSEIFLCEFVSEERREAVKLLLNPSAVKILVYFSLNRFKLGPVLIGAHAALLAD